jgi:hypothetical protein
VRAVLGAAVGAPPRALGDAAPRLRLVQGLTAEA